MSLPAVLHQLVHSFVSLTLSGIHATNIVKLIPSTCRCVSPR